MDDSLSRDPGLSRRRFLNLVAVGGAGLAATACGVSTASSSTGTTGAGTAFRIVSSGARLPRSKVQVKWMDSGDQKANFFDQFFPRYTKKHPNITVNYTGLNWTEIQQVITLGLENGSAPDVFQLPTQLTPGQAVHNKWVAPIDDLFPDFATWKARFPAGTFADGITDFGGKTYGMPLVSNVRINYLSLYNKGHLRQAGYDPGERALTWDEFRTALKKITKQGAGRYYGFILGVNQSGQLSGLVDTLAEMAGANAVPGSSIAPVNPFTGHYNFASDQYVAAVELVMAIKSDGSFFPGSASLTEPTVREQFANGVAGMTMDGPWCIGQWQTQNPGFSFGVGLPPVQTSTAKAIPLGRGPGGAGKWFVPTTTKLGPVVGDLFYNIMTTNGQTEWNDDDGGADPSLFPQAMKVAKLSPLVQKSYELAQKWMVLGPEAAVRKPQIADVYEAQVTPTPSWPDTMSGLFTGQITGSVESVMKDLQDRYEASLDTAIATVNQREGTRITRDDFLFTDWNPRQPYSKLYKEGPK